MALRRAAVRTGANAGASAVQRRAMSMPAMVPTSMRMLFAQHFRGRGMKKRQQMVGSYDQSSWRNQRRVLGGPAESPKRLPDIDDPRPAIIGWRCHSNQVDHDGTLPLAPYEEPLTDGRRVMQGLYCDFREVYNQHYTYVPMYGGGEWDPDRKFGHNVWVHPTATLTGCTDIDGPCFIHANCVLRADLNQMVIRSFTHILPGCILTTDGHPRNTHRPGRVSRINEGSLYVGEYTIVHPNCTIDSAMVSAFCEVGEGCTLGNGSVMENYSSLEPGTVLLANQRVPRYEIWGGNPARRIGYRDRDMTKWIGRLEQLAYNHGISYANEQLFQTGSVSATRNCEQLQRQMDSKVGDAAGTHSKVQEYIARFTADIPLWELYKNMTRMNTKPGIKREWGWTLDPKKARWVDHY